MDNLTYKSFEERRKEKMAKACIDTGFTLHGDNDFLVKATHDFVEDTWLVETSLKGEVVSLLQYENKEEVINYLSTKEDTYLPAIGVVYDDLMHVIQTKNSGIFNASSKVLITSIEKNYRKHPQSGVTCTKKTLTVQN